MDVEVLEATDFGKFLPPGLEKAVMHYRAPQIVAEDFDVEEDIPLLKERLVVLHDSLPVVVGAWRRHHRTHIERLRPGNNRKAEFPYIGPFACINRVSNSINCRDSLRLPSLLAQVDD